MNKFLLDACVSRRAIPQSLSKYDIKIIPQYLSKMRDARVLKLAKQENRVLITRDKDFYRLIGSHKHEHSGIIFLFSKKPSNKKFSSMLHDFLIINSESLNNKIVLLKDDKLAIFDTIKKLNYHKLFKIL